MQEQADEYCSNVGQFEAMGNKGGIVVEEVTSDVGEDVVSEEVAVVMADVTEDVASSEVEVAISEEVNDATSEKVDDADSEEVAGSTADELEDIIGADDVAEDVVGIGLQPLEDVVGIGLHPLFFTLRFVTGVSVVVVDIVEVNVPVYCVTVSRTSL